MVDTMELARAERADLAEFLAGLEPAQWDAPTLCEGWRVRDVVAHVYSYDDVGVGGLALRLLRSRMDLGRANDDGVAADAQRPPSELVARARACVRPRGMMTMMGGRIALTDATIHHQDLRRPLGLPRAVPPERLTAVLGFARTAPPLRSRARVAGLRLVASDVDFSAGDGPVVEGPGEALLMAVAGRRGVVDELSGPGAATLRERIGG